MEVTAKRVLVLSSVLILFGVAALVQPRSRGSWKSEQWVEGALPTRVGDFIMKPSSQDPAVSYKATPFEYEALRPFGIVGRIFDNGKREYDSSAVVGNDRDCFHDPNFCMAGQYYNISGEHMVQLETKTRGVVPVSVMSAEDNDGKRLVAFCYLGPHGFHPTQDSLYADWFWTELLLGKPKIGAYYRFMTTTESDTEANLLDFAKAYLDAAKATSKGEL